MVTAGSSFFTLSDRPPLDQGGPEAGPVVVWLWGEHDASTDTALSLTLARAIAVDSPGLVLDLSEVDFIGPSTLAIIVGAREYLRQRSASLTVRSPSAVARDIIEACGLADLLGPDPEMAGAQRGTALSSWVAVPVADRSDGQPAPSVLVPERVPASVGHTIDLRAQAVSAGRLAESG
jgi:anti-anti-sigma factor